MKKGDLKIGNVVETRTGEKYIYNSYKGESLFVSLESLGAMNSEYYNANLTTRFHMKWDIMKVYKDYTCKELLWERKEKPQLTEDEKVILKNVPKEYKWIARDKNGSIFLYINKPVKRFFGFDGFGTIRLPFNHLFQFIKWEDEEPYSIEELLGEEK